MGITFGLTPLVGHAWAQKNKQEADELAKKGMQTALDHFNIKETVNKIESVYFSVADKKASQYTQSHRPDS